MAKVYRIGGITCNHCKTNVEKNLAGLKGVTSVQVDLSSGTAYVEGSPDNAEIKQTVTALGYELLE